MQLLWKIGIKVLIILLWLILLKEFETKSVCICKCEADECVCYCVCYCCMNSSLLHVDIKHNDSVNVVTGNVKREMCCEQHVLWSSGATISIKTSCVSSLHKFFQIKVPLFSSETCSRIMFHIWSKRKLYLSKTSCNLKPWMVPVSIKFKEVCLVLNFAFHWLL